MLVKLGDSKEPSDIVDLLLECHGRIRSFIALAQRLGQSEASADEVRSAAAAIRRYFSEALPLHMEDEEKSILPRLRGRNPELDGALHAMEREHAQHEPLVASLVRSCRELESAPERIEALRNDLFHTASMLESDFRVHLDQEERVVFPMIRQLGTTDERDSMLRELRERRRR